MGDEARGTPVIPQEGEILGTEVVNNAGLEVLGGEAAPSEAELMGHDEGGKTPTEAKTEETKPAEKAAEAEKKPEEKAEAKSEEKAEERAEAKPEGKPPKGFVPKGALTEERQRRKDLQEENEALRKQVTELQQSMAGRAPFKQLSREEEDTLAEEDPTAFNKYLRDKTENLERQRHESTLKQSNERVVRESMNRMVAAIPDIHNPDFNRKLTTFAIDNGMDDKTLAALTDPRTQFMPPWSQTPVLLGHGAVNLIEMIHNFREKVNAAPDEAAMRDAITKELEPKIREQVTAELMAKFRDGGKKQFVSLGEVPGSSGEKDIGKSMLNEKEFANLSAEDQRAALGG